MTQAESLDDIALRVPADADVLVSICADNVLLIFSQEECRQQRGVTQDEVSVRWVFVGRQRAAFRSCSRRRGRDWRGRIRVKRIAARDQRHDRVTERQIYT